MSEPSRKRQKGGGPTGTNVHELEILADPLVFITMHKDRPTRIDLREFETGGNRDSKRRGSKKWAGDFRGRPQLIAELAPAIKQLCANTPSTTWTTQQGNLRMWWRLMDQHDDVAPVVQLSDITDVHGALSMRSGMKRDQVNFFEAIVNYARLSKKLPLLYWPKVDRDTKASNLPDPEIVGGLYHLLKRQIYATIDRFDACDALAAEGADWSSSFLERAPRQPWTVAEMHATYRGIIRKTQQPCPNKSVSLVAMEARATRALEDRSVLVYGLYPSYEDVVAFYFIFLLRTGWNGQTALDIDISTSYLIPHPTSNDHHIVRSVKSRGNTEQTAIGLNKSQLSPGGILRFLVAKTAPLREELKKKLAQTEAALLATPKDHELFLHAAELRRTVRSPWLFVNARQGDLISWLDAGSQGAYAVTFKKLQKKFNETLPDGRKADLTLSDFRDAYIAFAYENSGYSWLVAKLAAGHKSIESLKNYLRHRQHKAHGEKKVVLVSETFWDEIRNGGLIDPAIIFARVQRGSVTTEQRRRWREHKDRTRLGVGCRDFRNPPPEIAPGHIAGAGCRNQRCSLCEHAVLFEDSLDHLARRTIELIYLRQRIPLAAWFQSSFEEELEQTERILRAYNDEKVKKAILYWEKEVESGRHIPLQFEGEYRA